jgi:hypothetical protein
MATGGGDCSPNARDKFPLPHGAYLGRGPGPQRWSRCGLLQCRRLLGAVDVEHDGRLDDARERPFLSPGRGVIPASYRSTPCGVRAVVGALGAALGLFIEGLLFNHFGSRGAAITAMLLITPIAPVRVAIFLPETASREVEEIAPEREAP